MLGGAAVRVEPLDPARHAADLYAASHGPADDGALWTYMPYGPFPDVARFCAWAEDRAASDDPLFFAVIDGVSGRPGGMCSFLRVEPAMGVVEIGHIWFARPLQRTRQASEAIFLLQRHAFDELGYRRLEWKCDARNLASRCAALRFGFRHEGIFRQHMVVKGRNRDTAWYALLDRDWPRIKANFERWLAPDNFDGDGRQRIALSALNEAAPALAAEGL